jgi:hypothetical protein
MVRPALGLQASGNSTRRHRHRYRQRDRIHSSIFLERLIA